MSDRGVHINMAAVRRIVNDPKGPVARDLLRRGFNVRNRAVQLCPVDTGRLRSSITVTLHVRRGHLVCRVGTNVSYACVFGAHTRVVTSDGTKTIGQVKVGDLVLTQSGEYRPVVAATRFPVTEKPDLVEITVPWRSGQHHTLTVTADHKILAERDGRKKWIKAGDLLMTDLLHVRPKTAHNKGAGRRVVCAHCQTEFGRAESQGDKFCGMPCRDAYWQDRGHWMLDRDRGVEFARQQSASRRRLYAERPSIHPNRTVPRVTDAEVTVATWLALRNVEFEHRRNVAGMWPDFYVPAEHRIYEADGAYWHRDQQKDIERDRALQAAMPGVEIVHLHFYDRRHTPALDPSPVPGVHYVTVNPSPASYVEPSTFAPIAPATIRAYRWQPGTTPRATKVPYLYDLAVDGDHSFLANGVLVSNSWVHEGTGLYGPHRRRIYPKRAKVMRFKPKGSTTFVYAKSIRGMRARPFLRLALTAAT